MFAAGVVMDSFDPVSKHLQASEGVRAARECFIWFARHAHTHTHSHASLSPKVFYTNMSTSFLGVARVQTIVSLHDCSVLIVLVMARVPRSRPLKRPQL